MTQENTHPVTNKTSGAALLRSGLWVAADNWSQQILQFLCFLYVGNLIGPSATGMMTISLTYMLLMHALLMNSFTNVIIQRADVTDEHYNTAFWVNAGLGLAAMLVSAAAAPLIAWTLGEPAVTPIIMALSPMCLAMGLISFYEAKIRRELRFNALAGRSIASVGLGFTVAIILALKGAGVWSLVAYQLVWRVVEVFFVMAVAHWRPTGFISRNHLNDLLDFSLHSIGIRLVDFFAQNFGRILVGYFLGMHALGLYQLARRFVDAPLNALSGVFQGLALPLFARLQKDRVALSDAVLTSVQLAGFVTIPAFTGLFLVIPELVAAFLRPEWRPIVELVQIFCVMGVFMSITHFFGTAVLALGHAALTFRTTAILLAVRIFALAAFAKFGLVGLACAEVLVVIVGFALWYGLLHREIPLGLQRLAWSLTPVLLSTLTMAVCVTGFEQIAARHMSAAALALAMIAVGALSFIAAALILSKKDIVALKKFVQRGA